MIRTKDNLVGKRYGRLTVLKRGRDRGIRPCWVCQCLCGNLKEIRGNLLKNGNTSSCGCYAIELRTKHGMTEYPEYRIWANMLNRIRTNDPIDYPHYKGRGITVCKRWLKFENFYADMGERPSKRHSIDRINNDGNYCIANCRWATPKQQSRNRSDNYLLEYKGEIKTLSEWAEVLNIKRVTLCGRLTARKWSVKRAFETPVQVQRSIRG